MTTEIQMIEIDKIDVSLDRARDLDEAWAEALGAMIVEQGLINPITVRVTENGYSLVTGQHRLEAMRRHTESMYIPARISNAESDDEARLEELMENLGRQELKALDRCHHLFELRKVWLHMHPEAAAGGDRKSGRIKAQKLRFDRRREVFGFGRAIAEKTGLSVRSIETAAAIWRSLSPLILVRLARMPLANKMTELKALSEQRAERQAAILELILSEAHPDIQNVAEALFHLENGVTPNLHERRYMAAAKSLSVLDDVLFDRVIMAQEERVIASLKRRGRI